MGAGADGQLAAGKVFIGKSISSLNLPHILKKFF
jgi:hypothetical protein